MQNKIDVIEKITVEHGPVSIERIDYLDGWRGLAIACVLQAHFMPIRGFDSGNMGVHIFFVLSGLLMAKLLFIKRTPLATFYERRFSRVIPVFILYLISMYSIAYFKGNHISYLEVLSTVTFLRTYYPAFPNIFMDYTIPSGHLWSLNIEEHSYVIMSMLTLIIFIKKREGLVLICIGLIAIFIELYYTTHKSVAPEFYGARTQCAISFIMISAGYSLVKGKFTRYVTPIMPIISLIIAFLCYLEWFQIRGASVIIAPFLLSFAVNHLSEAREFIINLLCLRPLRLLGLWSYSIYLWQQPFYLNRDSMYPGVSLLLAVIVAIASFYLFENPARRWINEKRYLTMFDRYGNSKISQPD